MYSVLKDAFKDSECVCILAIKFNEFEHLNITVLWHIGLHTLSPIFSLDHIIEGGELELEVADDGVATLA